ncbi:hypothetical protein [Pararhizobium arenae]|uniref:hypothetical protein n=1 Tax=Pararhizobium arenae TaxID=1856850 RepID=UPI00094A9F7A|nr:hypothetical protein [Pararhizobium arenae]
MPVSLPFSPDSLPETKSARKTSMFAELLIDFDGSVVWSDDGAGALFGVLPSPGDSLADMLSIRPINQVPNAGGLNLTSPQGGVL